MGEHQVVVNGNHHDLTRAQPPTTALEWLRDLGFTGAKEGCAEGECGACSVLLARAGTGSPTEWTAINACLLPAAALSGQEVVTAEGLGSPEAMHPVQQEMAARGGSQCGYCTPGFVCSMAAEYYRPGRSSPDVRGTSADMPRGEHGPNGFDLHALSGNLCRCTGYRPIRDAAYALESPPDTDTLAERANRPPPVAEPTRMPGWARPADITEALTLLSTPGATAIAGSTDLGVEANLAGSRPELLVAIDHLPELQTLRQTETYVEIGAALTLSDVERNLDGAVALLDEVWPQFASRLIRNSATIGGNLGTGSPVGDLAPALQALDANVMLTSPDGTREIPLTQYFTGYRTSVRRQNELISAVRVPLPLSPITGFHKIAKRRFDDISSVAVAFALAVDSDGYITQAAIGLGGVAATPIRARTTEAALVGQPWRESPVRHAAVTLASEGTPLDDHRASAAYRKAMLEQSLLRLHYETKAPV